jgi:hypothetical protein
MACHALPFHALQVANPKAVLRPFQGWLPTGQHPAAIFYPFGYPMPYAFDICVQFWSVERRQQFQKTVKKDGIDNFSKKSEALFFPQLKQK